MTITLCPEHEKAIAQAIQSGAYRDPDEVIGRALEVLRGEDEWLHEQKDEVARKIERAFGQFERGEFFSADESRADMERRKAAWLNEQQRRCHRCTTLPPKRRTTCLKSGAASQRIA